MDQSLKKFVTTQVSELNESLKDSKNLDNQAFVTQFLDKLDNIKIMLFEDIYSRRTKDV